MLRQQIVSNKFNTQSRPLCYALWAIGEGIVNGVGKNTLKPLGTATRAQVAKVIMVLDQKEK